MAASATAGAAASARGGRGGCPASLGSRLSLSFLDPTPSSDPEPTAGGAGNGGLDGFAPAHKGDPEEQDLYDFLCGSLGRAAAQQECRRRTEVSPQGRPPVARRVPTLPRPRPRARAAARMLPGRRSGLLWPVGRPENGVSLKKAGAMAYLSFFFFLSIYAYIIFLEHTS